MEPPNIYNKQFLLKEASKNGILNFVINGTIQYFVLKHEVVIPLTLDSISSNEINVAGASISLAIIISVILTTVGYFSLKVPKVPLLPNALVLIVKNAFLAYATLTALAVVWQRLAGSVEVSLILAVLIIGLISGIVAYIVSYVTIKKCVVNR